MDKEKFAAACVTLPEGVCWGDPLTPNIAIDIAIAALPAQAQPVPHGWREVVDNVRENICAGGCATNAQYERGIVEPYLDTIFDELEELEIATPVHAQAQGEAQKVYGWHYASSNGDGSWSMTFHRGETIPTWKPHHKEGPCVPVYAVPPSPAKGGDTTEGADVSRAQYEAEKSEWLKTTAGAAEALAAVARREAALVAERERWEGLFNDMLAQRNERINKCYALEAALADRDARLSALSAEVEAARGLLREVVELQKRTYGDGCALHIELPKLTARIAAALPAAPSRKEDGRE